MIQYNGHKWTFNKKHRVIIHQRLDMEAFEKDEIAKDKPLKRGKWVNEKSITVVPLEIHCKCGGDIFGPILPRGFRNSDWGLCAKCGCEWKPGK